MLPDIDLKEKISMVEKPENRIENRNKYFCVNRTARKKGACANRAAIVTFASHYAANLRGLE